LVLLFRRISISDSGISINLMNYSVQLKKNEIDIEKLEKYLSELSEFDYIYANINNQRSIDVSNYVLEQNKVVKWEDIDEERLIEIVEEIIENIPLKGEVN
jgi:hypothetical protein